MRELKTLCRQNIWALSLKRNTEKAPCQHKEIIALDKNENPYNKPFNTYPDSYQEELRQKVADIKGISKDNICLLYTSPSPRDTERSRMPSSA